MKKVVGEWFTSSEGVDVLCTQAMVAGCVLMWDGARFMLGAPEEGSVT